jgi:membrane peptidoglycan carboxypeptidase
MVAGKTGTTSNSVDARFVGYDSNLVTSVWMGYENADPKKPPKRLLNVHGIPEVTGGSLPVAIWREFMLQATQGLAPVPFAPPTIGGMVLNSTTTLPPTTVVPPTTVPDQQPPPPQPPQSTQPARPPSSTTFQIPTTTQPAAPP